MKNNEKVFVIGIDGATFDIIAPWLEQGRLPHLKSLIDNGCSGVLESSVPPVSPVAWPSFFTGVNPGKHGIFDFIEKSKTDQSIHFMNRTHCKAQPIWRYLNQEGYTTTIINIPGTYPPDKVDGFMISGLDTPDTNSEFTYPGALKNELKAVIGNYIIDMEHNPALMNNPGKYIDHMIDMIEAREKTALYLMEKYPVDFFMVVFTATDRVQHSFWRYYDKKHPGYSPGVENAIYTIYKRVDDAIGRLLDKVDESTSIIAMSDHGMHGIYKSVDVNRWLLENGFLVLKKESPVLKLKDFYKRLKRRYLKKADKILFDHYIDWSKTRAYFLGTWGNIFINVKGKEPYGIVSPGEEYESIREEIIRKLSPLADPENGKPVIKTIFRKEEVFTGEYLDKAPDLIIMWNEKYNCIKTLYEKLRSGGRHGVIQPYKQLCGDHAPNGIFVYKSPHVKKGITNMKANIIDLLPTILHTMDVTVPNSIDGRILDEIFTEEFLAEKSAKYDDKAYAFAAEDESVYSDEDSQKIAERLTDLGYFD
ncbi:alkaline phosphatase family protein [Candidatus Kuenenia sp.]|uniref:alkaline phosphatase family protein n=1 Tax=Candidatus Kuenenia sp. TaxID=2499824 RepID=UPI00321FBFBE